MGKRKTMKDDIFMAAAIGDLEWLQHSMKTFQGHVGMDNNGFHPMHIASLHGRLDVVRYFIEDRGLDPNLPSAFGWRPIHLCISVQTGERSHKCLNYLIEKAADVNITNEDGTTPLHQAASEGHVGCLNALIAAGANVFVVDVRGNLPIDLAILWGHRACVRILNSLKWQRAKHDQQQTKLELGKLKMQKLLWEIEQEDMTEKQRLECRQIYERWLLDQGGTKKGAKRDESAEKKDEARKERSEGELAGKGGGEGMRPKVHFAEHKFSEHRPRQPSVAAAPVGAPIAAAEQRAAPSPAPGGGAAWNFSCRVPLKSYIPNLPDIYPRDPFTMLPARDAAPSLKRIEALAQQRRLGAATLAAARAALGGAGRPPSKLPDDADEWPKQRRVVFQCEHVLDIGCKRGLPRADHKYKEQTCFHLSNDVASQLLAANAYLQPQPADQPC